MNPQPPAALRTLDGPAPRAVNAPVAFPRGIGSKATP